MSSKSYISFFGIKLIKIKKESDLVSFIYFCGVPLFAAEKKENVTRINLLLIYKTFKSINKRISNFMKYYREIKIVKCKNKIKNKFKKGNTVKVCLLVTRPGTWCFDYFFRLLKNDPRFDVEIVVNPDAWYGLEMQAYYTEETFNELTKKNYTPIKGYNAENKSYIDLRKDIKADIIFFTDFFKPHYVDSFYITNFLDKITLLTEYGYSVMQDEKTCAFELNNLVDIYFRPTEIHKKMAETFMKNKGRNVCVVGSPKLDVRFDEHYVPEDVWKEQPHRKKRIIWAPHHADDMPANMYRNNAFWEIYDFMLELADKYKNDIQFVFRPHPLLKVFMTKKWGKVRTEEYYERWNLKENTQYFDGNFVDLFMTSDAMIMDSCSFRAEYTSFDKPLFLTLTKTSRVKHNDFGNLLNEIFYETKDNLKDDIINFIDEVVLKGNDSLAEERHAFVEKHFSKINGKTASENIYETLVNYLES